MKINCNSCNTEYFVPASQIGITGRRVKCRNCSNIWFQESPNNENLIKIAKIMLEASQKNSSGRKINNGQELFPVKKKYSINIFNMYSYSSLAFIVMIILLFSVYSNIISNKFPFTKDIYNMAGINYQNNSYFNSYKLYKINSEFFLKGEIKNDIRSNNQIKDIEVTYLDKNMKIINKDFIALEDYQINKTDIFFNKAMNLYNDSVLYISLRLNFKNKNIYNKEVANVF